MNICDMTGREIKSGQIVNVFYTSSDGEFNHDINAVVKRGIMGDFQLEFIELAWEDYGHNQYPISTTFCLQYDSLGFWYNDVIKQYQLYIPKYKSKYNSNDQSMYIKIVEGFDEAE